MRVQRASPSTCVSFDVLLARERLEKIDAAAAPTSSSGWERLSLLICVCRSPVVCDAASSRPKRCCAVNRDAFRLGLWRAGRSHEPREPRSDRGAC